eukprot:jgi/Bigna1/85793/estExt_fgenesh1_pg.C_60131
MVGDEKSARHLQQNEGNDVKAMEMDEVFNSSSSLQGASSIHDAFAEDGDSILDYIVNLDLKESLYRDIHTAISVHRSLPPLAKNIVMRMLWLNDKGVSLRVISRWVKPDNSSGGTGKSSAALRSSLQRLEKLHIMQQDQRGCYVIERNFKQSLQKLVKEGVLFGGVGDMAADEIKKISNHARASWDQIMQYLIADDPEEYRKKIDMEIESELNEKKRIDMRAREDLIRKLLTCSGLVEEKETTGDLAVTSKGFRFLFLPQRRQVWSFLLGYVRHKKNQSRKSGVSEQDVLQFLFRLSHQHLGTGYNIKATLSSKEKSLLDDLRNIGLIHAKSKAKRKNYYPTALALSLSSTEDVTLENTLGQGHGKIIVETTMRLYAFTSSEFQIKILRKFVRLDVRLPNLVVGRITNVSISAALRNGITGDGIISTWSSTPARV